MTSYEALDRRAHRLVGVMFGLALANTVVWLLPWSWGRAWFGCAALTAQVGLFFYLRHVVGKRSAARREREARVDE